MKRKFLVFSFLSLFGLATLTANAQQPAANCDNTNCEKKEQCDKKGKDKQKCKDGKGKHVKADKKKGPRINPFEGINLTADQQAKIEKLKSDRKAERKQKDAAKKEAKKQAREKERAEFNAELAKILTPDQMAQYKANCDKAKEQMEKRKASKEMKRPAAQAR